MQVSKYQKGGRGNIVNIKHITIVVLDNARKKNEKIYLTRNRKNLIKTNENSFE